MFQANIKPDSRKRFAPLIETRLNNQSIPELVWVDKENKIFRMPWKHHKAAKWGDPDAFMLRELAKDLYKYHGPEIPAKKDLSYWKGLIRNNLKILDGDFEELPEMHVLESVNPYKVYRFVSNGAKQDKGHKCKTANKCQRRKNQCTQNEKPVVLEESSKIMISSNNIPTFLDDSVSQGGFPMSYAGMFHYGNAACDNMSSSQESADQDHSPCMVISGTNVSNDQFRTLPQQDDQHDIFEEFFQNTDIASQQMREFDVDVQNFIRGLESHESSDHVNSSSGHVPCVNGGEFLDDSSIGALSSMSSTGLEPRENAAYEYVNVSTNQRSDYQQRRPKSATSFDSDIDNIIRSLLQDFDQDDVSKECFLNFSHINNQQADQFNTSALQCEMYDFDSGGPKTTCNNFRSRSPLTTEIVPNPAAITSYTSSSCNAAFGNSTRDISSNRLNQPNIISANGVVFNNISQEAASVFGGMNYLTYDSNTVASSDICMVPHFAETLAHSEIVTATGTSSHMANDIVISGFSHRTFLSLTRMLSVRHQMPFGVEVSYYNSPSMQPRMMPAEFRICFVAESDEQKDIAPNLNEGLTVPQPCHLLELPPAQKCRRLNNCQIKNTNKVLNNLKDGILVSFKNGHIYATRYCTAGTRFSVCGRTEWQKLGHLKEVKIFDYNDYKRSYSSPNPAPIAQPFVRLSFAAKDPNKSILVLTVDIWHMEALLLARQTEENSSSLEPDLSLSNDFAEILRIGEMIEKSTPLPA